MADNDALEWTVEVDWDGDGQFETVLAKAYDSTETSILSLAVFGAYIYGGSGNNGKIYRSADGAIWAEVYDSTETQIYSLAVFGAYIYAGTYPNGKIFRSADGTTWAEVYDSTELYIFSLAVFGAYLYAGGGDYGKIYRSADGVTWAEVYDSTESQIRSLAVFGAYIYAGTYPNGKIFRSADGTTWSEVYDSTELYIFSLAVFGAYIYAGGGIGGKIFRSADGVTWAEVYDSTATRIYSLAVSSAYLYAGDGIGGKIFRSADGTTWEEYYDSTESWIYSLAAFGSSLYAGSGNNGKIYRLSDITSVDTNEAGRMLSISMERGRSNFLKPRGDGYEPVQTGRCQFTLSNHDGRYDGWNSASPLYPGVTYGLDVRIRVKDTSTGIIYPFFYGVISNIETNGYGTDQNVSITCEDGWRFLREYSGRAELHETITVSDAIELVLDSIGWPARWGRIIGVSGDTIRYFWSFVDKSAGSTIEDVVNSFLGYFYIAADGKATYKQRQVVESSSVDLDQSQLLKDISNPQPWEFFRNVTRFRVHPRAEAALGVIWQYQGNSPAIAISASVVIWANYAYNGNPCPAMNVVTPLAATDWTANTSPDGSGTDKTADVTLDFTDFGDTAKLKFTNGAGVAVYIVAPQVRGEAVYALDTSDVTYPSDPAGVSQPREFFVDMPWQQDINFALSFAEVVGPFMEGRHPFPSVQIENRPSLQFAPDLFSVATLTVNKLGIDTTSFRLSGIRHQSLGTPQAIRTVFTFEPYLSSEGFWTWDTASVFDNTTIFGW